MRFIFGFLLAIFGGVASAQGTLNAPIVQIDACVEGYTAIAGNFDNEVICVSPENTPQDAPTGDARTSCGRDWVSINREGANEVCIRLPEVNEHVLAEMIAPSELSLPAQLCGDGEVMYFRLDGPRCAPAFADAGEPCANALDCDGTCLGDTVGQGICSVGPLNFGCTDFLAPDGGVMSICID